MGSLGRKPLLVHFLMEKAPLLGVGVEDFQPFCAFCTQKNAIIQLPAFVACCHSSKLQNRTLCTHKPSRHPLLKLLWGTEFYHTHGKGTNTEVQSIWLLFTKEEIQTQKPNALLKTTQQLVKVNFLVRHFLFDYSGFDKVLMTFCWQHLHHSVFSSSTCMAQVLHNCS